MTRVRSVLISALCVMLVLLAGVFVGSPLHAEELSASERADLQNQYDALQQEISQWQKVLDETRAKKNTLQGDVTLLDAQIKQAEAQIKQKNIAISNIQKQIQAKTAHISVLVSKINLGEASLASLIRQQNQVDDLSLVEVVMGADNAFKLFADVDHMTSVGQGLQDQFAELRGVKKQTETERAQLTDQQNAELDAKFVVETKKQVVAKNEADKKQLLAITASQEAQYQQVLADRQAKAEKIRARLFPLRDTPDIQFGDAVRYAQEASGKTGVSAALIIAVLSQESDLGKNVGNCYVTDLTTGNGVGKNTGTPFTGVMKAPRDTVPFQQITDALGKDWSTTAVSCPLAGGGYGGAMGPTQFIPSTWKLFEPRLKAALNVSATNPWNAEHAIMAAALYLADRGAAAGTYTAQRNAACAYFSGSSCPSGGWVASYGDQVIAKATAYQNDIDTITNN